MMQSEKRIVERHQKELFSEILDRKVLVDLYMPHHWEEADVNELLLINDGQDLISMDFASILEREINGGLTKSLIALGIHAGKDRLQEYGVIGLPDYKGRGALAHQYRDFIMQELMPACRQWLNHTSKTLRFSIAGFSLGGLSALDLLWKHPDVFQQAAVFSGALWWREKDQQDPDFDEQQHLIMHRQVREGVFHPDHRFFFEAGTEDEKADRNKNGIIDSIDDTLSLISALKQKGYQEHQIKYLEIKGGKHDIPTWASAFPPFLQWGWGVH